MAATIVDVAKRAGVGVGTVSRVINGAEHVRDVTRARVEAAMSELGYHPNAHASNLKRNNVRTLGYLFSAHQRTVTDPFFSSLMFGMADAAAKHDFDLHVASCSSPDNELATLMRMMMTNRVSGVILTDTRVNDERAAYLASQQFPAVTFGRVSLNAGDADISGVPYVDVDGASGVRKSVEHLLAQGHTRIGFIMLPQESTCAQDRLAGYIQALHCAGIAPRADYMAMGGLKEAEGEAAMRQLLDVQPRPTAVVACSDMMAFGAMRTLQQCGLRAGVDIALTGFDDVPLSAHSSPPLTTVHQPIYDIGNDIVTMLVQQVGNSAGAIASKLIEPKLIVRESSAQRFEEVSTANQN